VSKTFDDTIVEEFCLLDKNNFHVNLSGHRLFLCGGPIDATAAYPVSFRDRLYTYTATKASSLHDSFVLAEHFKDYFKKNTYTDLLAFEDDIASLSTLVIIFLESPGALVELGMFCNKPGFYKKLIIIAPQKKVQEEDSFIFLGPLEYIKKKDSTSVAIFP